MKMFQSWFFKILWWLTFVVMALAPQRPRGGLAGESADPQGQFRTGISAGFSFLANMPCVVAALFIRLSRDKARRITSS
jgi:hypothetical protein